MALEITLFAARKRYLALLPSVACWERAIRQN